MKLSNQAIGAIMMTLQKGMLEKIDVVGIFRTMDFVKASSTKKWGSKSGEMDVENPPVFHVDTAIEPVPTGTEE